ncbi:MAG TPA: outer membrane beta-barrel protein [Thermoanaerobaculia bacterium]|nr:outer membrane beta-barrel protein [Thermoanaerobaculia bacterium]
MRKAALLLLLLTVTTTAFAQDDDDWRGRRGRDRDRDRYDAPRDNAFEITPFVGYRWGGTIFANQTFIFGEDVDVEPSMNLGGSIGIPLGDSGFKLELMANHQSSELETGSGLFEPDNDVADIDVTYIQGGLQIPFARSRNASPYVSVMAGIANLDPQIRGVSAEQRFSASAGIGVKVPMNSMLSFRFEGRGYYTSLEEEDECTICDYFYNEDFYQGEVNAGLVFSF